VNLAPLVADPRRTPNHAAHEGLLGTPVVFEAHRPVLLAGPVPEALSTHRARFDGRRHEEAPVPPGRLLDAIEQVQLAGRGGAHFDVATKWRSTLAAGGGGMVVANGAEGEPASVKDAALLLHRPHLVLDGLARAAQATGASTVVVWLHDGARDVHRSVTAAVNERRAGRIREPQVRIVSGPDAYLSGESSAVVRALSGGPALPAFRRVPAATSGVHGLPTLVHNVETLARIGLIARSGGAGYRDSSLVTVLQGGYRTVLDVDRTTSVEAAVTRASGTGQAPQAVLLGGYGGSWLAWSAAADLPLAHRALRAAGAGLGAGVVVPLPARSCGLSETAAVVDYLARSSARQCGPCLFGLRSIADLLLALTRGEGKAGHLRRLSRYVGEVAGRGACHHPDGAVRFVATALATFADDIDQHARRGKCLHPGTPPVLPVPPERSVRAGRRSPASVTLPAPTSRPHGGARQ
jgi:NADH:ubiquinone oxidoreductase subunit F (NADH-binding)